MKPPTENLPPSFVMCLHPDVLDDLINDVMLALTMHYIWVKAPFGGGEIIRRFFDYCDRRPGAIAIASRIYQWEAQFVDEESIPYEC
jgi:hypothetical protein